MKSGVTSVKWIFGKTESDVTERREKIEGSTPIKTFGSERETVHYCQAKSAGLINR